MLVTNKREERWKEKRIEHAELMNKRWTQRVQLKMRKKRRRNVGSKGLKERN